MTCWVKINDSNTVVAIWNTLPPEDQLSQWKEAIEVRPSLIPNKQRYGNYLVDLSSTPVQIIWTIIDLDDATIRKNNAIASSVPRLS
jgi:hypothetical protein